MFRLLFYAAGLWVMLALSGCASCCRRSGAAFEFALIGDMPYTEEAATNLFPNLIREVNRSDIAFVVHDGDIKSGASPCSDEMFRHRFEQLQSFNHPLFLTFGDNEWQDCGGNKTSGFDPLERLAKLREMFAAGDTSLGGRKLKLVRQSDDARFADYRENIRWVYGDIVFAGFNIPGGANNFGQPEFKARNEANCAWLKDAFALAKKENRRGIMLVIQANPHFDLPATNQVRRGFNQWLKLLEEETLAFGKPVVLVHGDTHYFRIDKPLLGTKSKRRIEHFTRVETFGYPDVHWLRARVDPRDPNLFSFHIELVEQNLVHK
jgi:hypothetical protein